MIQHSRSEGSRAKKPIRFPGPQRFFSGMFDFAGVVHYDWNVKGVANAAVPFRVPFVSAGGEAVIRFPVEEDNSNYLSRLHPRVAQPDRNLALGN